MRALLLITRREFFTTIKRKGYIFTTLGLPLFFLIITAIVLIPTWISLQRTLKERAVGVMDEAGILDPKLAPEISSQFEGKKEELLSYLQGKNKDVEKFLGKMNLRLYAHQKEALADLTRGEIILLFQVKKNYLETGDLHVYYPKQEFISNTKGVYLFIKRLLVLSLLKNKVSPKILKRIQKPYRISQFTLDGKGIPKENSFVREIGHLGTPYFFALLLMFSMTITSAYLLQGLAEEKENRVIEILLSSVSAEELFAGKLLGLEGAALLQLMIWSLFLFIPAVFFLSFLNVTALMLLGCFVYCLLGILLCGSLTIGFGALGTRFNESHQLSFIWSFLSILPMLFFSLILDEPNGWLARCCSYFPLTSPVTMMMRLSGRDMDPRDIPLSIGILLLSIWFALKISAKLFRIGILLYGKRPSIQEIWRYLWL